MENDVGKMDSLASPRYTQRRQKGSAEISRKILEGEVTRVMGQTYPLQELRDTDEPCAIGFEVQP